ncbi:MAG: hypothetical protein ACR2QW_19520 [bacterium]
MVFTPTLNSLFFVGRVDTTEEIAEATRHLMNNGYTSGVVLDVDGGHMVKQCATK